MRQRSNSKFFVSLGEIKHEETCLFCFAGNVGNAFSVDSALGIISVSRTLERDTQAGYDLVVRAVDGGSPSLTSTVHVFIDVTVSDNAPPKFQVTAVLQVKSKTLLWRSPQNSFCLDHSKIRDQSAIWSNIVQNGKLAETCKHSQ